MSAHATTESDDEALFAALENEEDTSYRDHRIQQLNAEYASQKTNRDAKNAATANTTSSYPTITGDQSVLDFTTRSTRCIVHFAHDDFARCMVMDKRLSELAARHYEVSFARVDVRSTPFLTEKLGIRVLPCVIGFLDGVGVARVVGFEGLGAGGMDGGEGFSVKVLEKRLLGKGVLLQAKFSEDDNDDEEGSESEDEAVRRGPRVKKSKAIRSGKIRGDDDDDDWD
ncbi:uncharacterized protein N7469_009670 [Penicillium citrinum]|uniref:NTP binding protein n=2 Tax=Penicillium TaxID=5073 RepID=A0A9W9NJ90_PENCI|nr:uncharacterized protein N7469_009670 [Penicillium citrinum]KAJ5220783.1 hypothetical protein N7469_009670 [Penicillium citrinum]KAJ5595796.1 hypothetical protein N7450_002254 [Penicillium hetheringtonii]KAK5798557.1 hypothetical protein VI817_004847 [Penicillium citrinum]